MFGKSFWLILAALALTTLVGFTVNGALSATRGIRQSLADDRPRVSCDAYMEQRLGGAR